MTTIQIFEPGLCCGTGICGVEVDQQLITFSADMDWVRTEGGDVTRFNLAQEPLAFAENDVTRAFLHLVGQEGLPVVLVDGATVLTGRYPSRAELARWAAIGTAPLSGTSSSPTAVQPEGSSRLLPMATDQGQSESACCSGPSCC